MHLFNIIDEVHTRAVTEYGAMQRYISLRDYEDHIGFRITSIAQCSELINGIYLNYNNTNHRYRPRTE